jgi:hypothetical protein
MTCCRSVPCRTLPYLSSRVGRGSLAPFAASSMCALTRVQMLWQHETWRPCVCDVCVPWCMHALCREGFQDNSHEERILVTMTIDIDGTNSADLNVRESDDPWTLANRFLSDHGLNPDTIIGAAGTLAQFLEQHIGTTSVFVFFFGWGSSVCMHPRVAARRARS